MICKLTLLAFERRRLAVVAAIIPERLIQPSAGCHPNLLSMAEYIIPTTVGMTVAADHRATTSEALR